MIVWVNGTFCVGKTTTTREVCSIIPDVRVVDAEHVGCMATVRWRHDHLDAYRAARSRLAREAEVIGTSDVPPSGGAREVVAGVRLAAAVAE